MAVLKDLIVHGASRFLNGINADSIETNAIKADSGIFNQLIATTLEAKDAHIDELTANNATVFGIMDVKGKLQTNQWEAASIANIGGNFYISPTGKSSSGTVTITRTSLATSSAAAKYSVAMSGTFAVSSTSSTIWTAGAYGMATGNVAVGTKKYPLGTCDGPLSNITIDTNTITGFTISNIESVALDIIFDENSSLISSNAISSKPGTDLQVSVYLGKNGSNYMPIGILLTSYGKDDKQYIDIYNGENSAGSTITGFANPVVRIGDLNGLNPYSQSGYTINPSGWGIYTSRGYFKGEIYSEIGYIGGWTIDGTAIKTNNKASITDNTSGMRIDSANGIGFSGVTYFNKNGTGKIGPWTLTTGAIHNGKLSNNTLVSNPATNTTTSGVYLGTDGLNISGGTAATTSYITKNAVNIGNKLTWNGSTSILSVNGEITASKLTISSGATIGGDGANQILNSEIEVGGRNLLVGTAISITKTTTATSSYVTQSLYYTPSKVTLEELGLQAGDKITLSFDWKITSASTYGNARIEYYGTTSSNADAYITALVNPFATFSSTNTSGHFVTTVTLTDATIKTKRLLLRIDNSNLTLTISNLKLEKGNKATDWTPAPEDANDSEYIAGTQTTSTRFWTGNTSISELKDGLQITYWLPYATKSETAESKNITAAELNPTETITTAYSNTWLKLTLANGTTTDWIPCYYNGTSRLTTHYGANNIVRLTYKTNVGSIAAGWWSDANYNTNDVDRKRINNNVIVRENITQYCVAGYIIPSSGTAGYRKLISGSKIDLSYPIAYLSQANISGQSYAVASDGVTTNFYTAMPSVNLRNTKSNWAGTQYAMCYIKGTVSGDIFTVHSDIFTTTTPSTEDNFYYIPIGILYSTYQVNFDCKNQLYVYKDGAFGPVSIREASAAAKTATNFIAADTTNGIMVYDGQNGTQTYSSVNTGNVVITSTGMKVRGGTITLADYGTTITLGQETSGSLRTKIDSDTFWITNGTTDIAFIGNENKTVTDTFVSDGSTLTYTLNSIWLSGGTFSPSSVTGSKISGENKISINSGTLPAAGETFTYTYTPSSAVTYYTMGTRNSLAGIGDYSFAEGKDVISSGLHAHAEGYQTEASGKQSHAEGYHTYAYGNYSHTEGLSTYTYDAGAHAEGNNTRARGYASHAEGEYCKAKGDYSHAEGFYTEASESAHAEGYKTNAYVYAHAEGFETKANGFYSHTQNRGTETNRTSQTVIGEYNAIDTADTTAQRDPDLVGNTNIHYGDYAFIIGNGTDDSNRSNAVAVNWAGQVMAQGISYIDGGYHEFFCGDMTTQTRAVNGNLTNASPLSDWIPALIKAVCAMYPGKSGGIFKGRLAPSANAYFEFSVYNTSTLSSGMPQYAYGTYRQYPNYLIDFWVTNYVYGQYIIKTS